MYPSEIASICHDANRRLCIHLGDNSQLLWEEAPDWQKASALDGVLAILDGRITSPEQSHENWLADKKENGWKYGPAKDPIAKTHPCIVPFNALPYGQQLKDVLFFSIVRAFK